jgi:hypothetical protein
MPPHKSRDLQRLASRTTGTDVSLPFCACSSEGSELSCQAITVTTDNAENYILLYLIKAHAGNKASFSLQTTAFFQFSLPSNVSA